MLLPPDAKEAGMGRILRTDDVLELLAVSRTTLNRWIKEGQFPKPFKIGGPKGRAVGWYESDVEEYLKQRREEAMA